MFQSFICPWVLEECGVGGGEGVFTNLGVVSAFTARVEGGLARDGYPSNKVNEHINLGRR